MKDVLARKALPDGTIDLGIGEAKVVREALFKCHPGDIFKFKEDPCVWEYQHPSGYGPLARELEEKHEKPVVITCGAKQGLNAVFYSLRKRGKLSVGMRVPYWSQLPHSIRTSGLNVLLGDARDPSFDSYLHVAPNNPDGHLASWDEDFELYEELRSRNVPFIHDAAYYHQIYMPKGPTTHALMPLGDVSIYSISKQYGMSGMRLGYVVCNDTSYYEDIMDYVETTTVGASAVSQKVFYEILMREKANPDIYENFVQIASNELMTAKALIHQLDPQILDVSGVHDAAGMFGWFKKGPLFRPDEAGVHVIDGAAFGDRTRVRVNLAVGVTTLVKAIQRLTEAANT